MQNYFSEVQENKYVVLNELKRPTFKWFSVLHLLSNLHGLLIIRFEELKVLVDLHSFPAVLANIKH